MLSKIGLTLILGGLAVCALIAMFNRHLPSAELLFIIGAGMILVGAVLKILFGYLPGASDTQERNIHGSGSDSL